MRLLLELLLIAALIAFGWEKSYHQWLGETPVIGKFAVPAKSPPPAVKAVAARPVASASPNGAWMWQKNGTLDQPAQKQAPKSFTGHILYADEHGKEYWLDAQGQRHYEP